MAFNIMCCIFAFFATFTGGVGLLINCVEIYLPVSIRRSYRFGKYSVKEYDALAVKCEIPKRCFKHFYIFAGPASTVVLCLLLSTYFWDESIAEMLFTLLDTLFGENRKPTVSAGNAILAAVLLNVQCWKRLYETCLVNIFSEQKINISHYFVGFIHYLGTLLSIIGESEGFVRSSHITSSSHKLTAISFFCAFIFLWFSYLQFKTNFILANLRKNKNGAVTTYDYKIPVGGLFKYITSPLQFTEIMIYMMLSVILWNAFTFHYITIWVVTNQAECAYLSHQWYRKTFKNYPKDRKICIPYIW